MGNPTANVVGWVVCCQGVKVEGVECNFFFPECILIFFFLECIRPSFFGIINSDCFRINSLNSLNDFGLSEKSSNEVNLLSNNPAVSEIIYLLVNLARLNVKILIFFGKIHRKSAVACVHQVTVLHSEKKGALWGQVLPLVMSLAYCPTPTKMPV